jgi:hypothetical protein
VRYAFTGPSHLTMEQILYVELAVRRLSPAPTEITTGCANGADTVVCVTAQEAWPNAVHRIVVPAAPHNDDLVARFKGTVITMPSIHATVSEGQRRARAYRQRNNRMLAYADELVAFVRTGGFYRSGEWMTIHIAEEKGIHVVRHLLP